MSRQHLASFLLALLLGGCIVDDDSEQTSVTTDELTFISKPPRNTDMKSPGRAAVFGFAAGATTAELRVWLNHGEGELAEMTGPNDKQVVGDFKKLGHDQVLSINYNEQTGARRVVLSRFDSATPLGGPAPAPLYSELFGASSLFDDYDDEEDLAVAGDFLALGYDQLMVINRSDNDVVYPTTPRMRIVDLRGSTPQILREQTYQQFAALDFGQRHDSVLVGDFRGRGYDQVLYVNNQAQETGRVVLIHDFVLGTPPYAAQVYAKSFAQLPELRDWHDLADRQLVGDFMGLGYDQVMFLSRQKGPGRVRIMDFKLAGTGSPITWYHEETWEHPLLNGWHDALGDWAFAGDFAGLGREQVLFMNRSGSQGRVLVADFGAGKPAKVKYLESWGASTRLDGFTDDDDEVLVGRFTIANTAGLLSFNNAVVGQRMVEHVATSPADLKGVLNSSFRGRVIIPAGVDWDFNPAAGQIEGPFSTMPLRTGVHLVGQRGPGGRRPILRNSDRSQGFWLFAVAGSDVRVEGIHFIGPAGEDRSSSQLYSTAVGSDKDVPREVGLRLVITDNEFERWTMAGVATGNQLPYGALDTVDHGMPRQAPEDVGMVHVVGNYFHHNARDGAGYGVVVGGGAYSLVEGNVFDRNRHAVSAGGGAYSGYTARYNYVLEGGFTQGFPGYYNQHFDVHGVGSGGYGGIAGEYFLIEKNAIRGEQGYHLVATRPSFMLRGKPTIGAYFNDNVDVHDNLDAAVRLKLDEFLDEYGENHADFNFFATGNIFNTDHAIELAAGDFDGDGNSDVFVATGTAWFFSLGGDTEWRFLRAAPQLTRDLGFADMDSDGVTDVIWRDPNGWLYYARGGRGAGVALAPSSLPVAQLRFHDLSGDGNVDVFRSEGGIWWLLDGVTRVWSPINTSGKTIDQLRFGEFDGVPGTDVVTVTGGLWQYSSAGRGAWTPLNGLWQPSLTTTAAVDIDRDGRTDIVFLDGNTWKWCRFGTGVPQLLRSGVDATFDKPQHTVWGNFNNDNRADAVRFPIRLMQGVGPGFLFWFGLGSRDAGFEYSRAML